MTTKQKVFSKEYTLHYSDYIKTKKGNETLKSIKSGNPHNNIINKFESYDQFTTLSKSFYKHSYLDNNNLHSCNDSSIRNLYYANISYNDKKINNKYNYLGKEDIYNCNLLKPVLYPYGLYKSDIEPKNYFPYKINLDHWCLKKRKCHIEKDDCYENCVNSNDDRTHNSNHNSNNLFTQNKCKTGLCKNTKPLFI